MKRKSQKTRSPFGRIMNASRIHDNPAPRWPDERLEVILSRAQFRGRDLPPVLPD
ncbi:MAG: hypothetical protein AAFX90_20025 [Pseudomonadota bacterium]